MEAVVCGCVGLLSAMSIDALLGGGEYAQELRRLRSYITNRLDLVRKEATAGVSKLEAMCARCGIQTARVKVQQKRMHERLPEAFKALAISLGSGLSLMQAIRYVGGHAEEPIKSEFLRAAAKMGCGVSASTALDELVHRLHAPGLDLVALALKVSRRTGAPLSELLVEASRLAGERVELERRLDVKTSQARMSARLVAWMPAAMIVFLTLFSTDFRSGVFTAPGSLSVLCALGLNCIAAVIIHRIMQVKI